MSPSDAHRLECSRLFSWMELPVVGPALFFFSPCTTRSAWLVCTDGERAVWRLRFPLNGSFRWARHLTCSATTSSVILHHGRWLWLLIFVAVGLASCLHRVTGPLDFRTAHYEGKWPTVFWIHCSLNKIEIFSMFLTNSKLWYFHSVSDTSCPPIYLCCWAAEALGGKKSQKKKNGKYCKWRWLLLMLQ